MNLSFAGCGFLGIYHVGVAVCFRKYAPHLLLNKISGASAGALAACCLLCDLPLERSHICCNQFANSEVFATDCKLDPRMARVARREACLQSYFSKRNGLGDFTNDILRVATEARSRSLGPFHPSFNIQNILIEGMQKILPADAHLIVNGKLHISLTRVRDGKNVIVSHFDSKEDLMQALLASAFIPLFSGVLPPKFHGVRYMDGGFSDNLPTLDENTITVSPFCGESDICPRDDSMQLFHINVANTSIELSRHNIYRIARILFPPKPEVLSNMCKQGFDDALRFLHRNNLINCTRCLAVQSTFVVSESVEESVEYDPQCHECKIHRQEALVSNLPDTVLTIFQEAIDSANKGLVNWIFKHRGMKLLSVLSLPYTLPCDMMFATFTNIVGDKYETRNFRYKIKGHLTVSNANIRKCTHLKPTRFMASAPVMGNTLWELSKYFMDQMEEILARVNKKRQQITAKISCNLAITEYGGNTLNTDSSEEELGTTNKMNLNFVLNLDDGDLPLNRSPSRKFTSNRILSRRPSVTINSTDPPVDDDTFDHILQVTAQHEAIMVYYYLDENNKVKVTEIFDVSESDAPCVQTECEKETNKQLEFDDDWDDATWNAQQNYLCAEGRANSLTELSEYSLEDVFERDTSNLFSDPESDWTGRYTERDETDDGPQSNDTRPESDQPPSDVFRRPYVVPSMNYDADY